jgi:hypothetical protein
VINCKLLLYLERLTKALEVIKVNKGLVAILSFTYDHQLLLCS